MSEIDRLREMIDGAKRIVAFTGAGISTESGIPDFRSPGGIWTKYQPIYFDDFMSSEEMRREAWRRKFATDETMLKAEPNAGHRALARLVEQGKMTAIITQNVDGLHQRSGVPDSKIIELHGNTTYASCLDCGQRYELEPIKKAFQGKGTLPICEKCDGIVKTATISFGQAMPEIQMARAQDETLQCDLFIVLGSSLVVYPAAGFPRIAKRRGARLVILNRDPTDQDDDADLVLHDEIGPDPEPRGRRELMLARGAFLAGAAALLPAAPPCVSRAQQDVTFFRILTGGTVGTYFPIGGLIANAISNPPGSRPCAEGGSCGVPGLVATSVTSNGSVANVAGDRRRQRAVGLRAVGHRLLGLQRHRHLQRPAEGRRPAGDRQPLSREHPARGAQGLGYQVGPGPARPQDLARRAGLGHAGRCPADPAGLRPQREGPAGAVLPGRSAWPTTCRTARSTASSASAAGRRARSPISPPRSASSWCRSPAPRSTS